MRRPSCAGDPEGALPSYSSGNAFITKIEYGEKFPLISSSAAAAQSARPA
jgi:hypothetical protein